MNFLDHHIQFGWLDLELSFESPSLRVSPLPDWNDLIASLRNSDVYGKDYIHMPLLSEPKTSVLVPDLRIELPPTHTMTLTGRDENPDRDRFLTAVLGFLLGLRLVPQGMGHLHRIRHTPRSAVSFYADTKEITAILESSLASWDAKGSSAGNRIFGAIHWYMTADAAYNHQFERFVFLYSVLDALHIAAWEADETYCSEWRKKQSAQPHHVRHADRVCLLAQHFGSPEPVNLKAIIVQRNELLHEARLAGRPIGFTATAEINEMEHSMTFFIEQIILGLLDVECGYRSAHRCFQQHGLDLIN